MLTRFIDKDFNIVPQEQAAFVKIIHDDGKVEFLIPAEGKKYHLPGEHDQSDHGNRGGELAERAIKEGGFTYNPVRLKNRVPPRAGYALSVRKGLEHVVSGNRAAIREQLIKYVKAHRDIIKQPGNFLGGWHDQKTGKVYLDVSKVTTDYDEAVSLASKADQLAIFDLGRKKTIEIKKAA